MTKLWYWFLCWLGKHHYVLKKEIVETQHLGYQELFYYECKYCGKELSK